MLKNPIAQNQLQELKYKIPQKPKNLYNLPQCPNTEDFEIEKPLIKCSIHKNEKIERICLSKNCKKKLLCIECIIEEADHSKKHKENIKPLNLFLELLINNIDLKNQNKDDEIIDEKIQDFLNENSEIKESFKNLMETEVDEIEIVFDDLNKEVQKVSDLNCEKLQKFFKEQIESFDENSDMMSEIINKTFNFEDIPGKEEINEDLTLSENSEELKEKIEKYLIILNPKNKKDTLSIFNIVHKLISKNLENPPKFENDEFYKKKKEEYIKTTENFHKEIIDHFITRFKTNVIPKLKEQNFTGLTQNLGNDNTNCLMNFEKTKGVKLQYQSKIKSPNHREFTCLTNLNNKFISYGTKDGFIEIYRFSDLQLVSILGKHCDSVNIINSFVFFESKNNVYQRFLVSSGTSDRKIVLWDFEKNEMFLELIGHSSIITSILDLKLGNFLVSASVDSCLIVWDIEKQKQIQKLEEENMVGNIKKYYNSINLKLTSDDKKLISADLKGNISTYTINQNNKEILQIQKTIQIYKPITHIFPSKIKNKHFLIKTTENKLFIINSQNLEIENTHVLKPVGDLVLLENKDSIFKQEILLINTNTIDDCISQNYLEDVSSVYMKDFFYSGISTRNRVQILEESSGDFKLIVLNKDLSSSVYRILA